MKDDNDFFVGFAVGVIVMGIILLLIMFGVESTSYNQGVLDHYNNKTIVIVAPDKTLIIHKNKE